MRFYNSVGKRLLSVVLGGVLLFGNLSFGYDATTSASTKEESKPTPVQTKPVEVKPTPKPVQPKPATQNPTTVSPTQTNKLSFHIVKKGDMLYKIAQMHNMSLSELLKLNPQIKNPNRIYVGQKVYVQTKQMAQTQKQTQTPTPVKPQPDPVKPVQEVVLKTLVEAKLENGVYRGSYLDGGAQQVGIEFTLENNKIASAKFRSLTYKGVNYLKPSNAKEEALNSQYNALLKGIIGKTLSEANTLLQTPEVLANDVKVEVDTYTGATLRSRKLAAALQDGVNRTPYVAKGNGISYDNGVYRGIFMDGNQEQVGVEFTLTDHKVEAIKFNTLAYKEDNYLGESPSEKVNALKVQYEALIQYLIGKDVTTHLDALRFSDLIAPTQKVEADSLTGATLRNGKVISAVQEGLNRGVYKPQAPESVSKERYAKSYEDGTYRGIFQYKGEQQVALEFTLKNNVIETIKYRLLAYKGVNYLSADAPEKAKALKSQYEALIKYLVGKPLSEVATLYTPEKIAKDITIEADALTGATLRSGKVTSAIHDALNKGIY